jgi:hypothetical protein
MIVTKKAISRRTVLRGVGAAVALPLLDAMVPALTASQKTAARPIPRLGIVYHPNGVVYENWLPTGVESEFQFSRVLAPFERFRDRVVVVTGLADRQAEALGDGAGDHSRASGSYLTGVHVKKSDSQVLNGISMDQIAARSFEAETQISSLQLTVDDNSLVGSCDVGYSCAYSNTLSWLTPTLPLMSENDPRVVFERLFGSTDSTDPDVRKVRLEDDRSILDSITERVNELQRKLGTGDRTKVSDYLESLRAVERQIRKAEEQGSRELPDVNRPVGIPNTFEDHVALLFDLQVLAYQCDLTRVITFMYGREQSARTYPQIGVPDPHHQLSHHANDPEKLERCTKIQIHHVELFAKYLDKLNSVREGDGTLLDSAVVLFGSGLSNSDRHTHGPLPTVVAGGGAGTIKGGRHLVYQEGTPLSNLHITLLDKIGVPADKLGDSTGKITELLG